MREIMICIAVTTIINWWLFVTLSRKRRQSDVEQLSRERDTLKRQLEYDLERKEADLKRQLHFFEEQQKVREECMKSTLEFQIHSKVQEAQAEATQTTVAGMLSLLPNSFEISLPLPPPGSFIATDGLPSSKGYGKWGDKYTFYTSQNRKILHCSACSSRPYSGDEINAYHLLNNNRYRPCKICMPKLPDMSWYEEYLKAINEVSEQFPNRPQ